MKKLHFITLLLSFIVSSLSSQNMCEVLVELEMDPNNSCQYLLTAQANDACGGYNFTQFTINAGVNSTDPADIKSIVDEFGGLSIETIGNSLAIITNPGITGSFILEPGMKTTFARLEFENGSTTADVSVGISGTNPDGLATDFTYIEEVDAQCAVANICNCMLNLVPDPNDPCCYVLEATLLGTQCNQLTFSPITVNTFVNGSVNSMINSATARSGFNLSLNGANTLATISSGTNFSNISNGTVQVADLCFENGTAVAPVDLDWQGTSSNGSVITSCTRNTAVDATCNPNPCVCNVGMLADPNDPCKYDVFATTTGDCTGITFNNIDVNSLINAAQSSTIIGVSNLATGTTSTINSATNIDLDNATGWPLNNVPYNIAQVEFGNGPNNATTRVRMTGVISGGAPAVFCDGFFNVDATCVTTPTDCSCQLDLTRIDDCCYEVGVTFSGADCASMNYNQVDFNSASIPALASEIQALIPELGLTATPLSGGNTMGSITSPSNLAIAIGTRIPIGEVCLKNPVNPTVASLSVSMMDAGLLGMSCQDTYEVTACPEPIPFDKLIGDSLSNVPIKIIPVGFNKLQVLANTDDNGVNYGVLIQYDFSSSTIDWIHRSDPNIFYADVVFHPGVQTSYIVGNVPQSASVPDNEGVITTVDLTGQCVDVALFQQTGREQFRKIIYHPSSSFNDHDLYIVGAKNASLPASQNDILFLTNIQTNLVENWYTRINHTGDDEMYRGIIPKPNGDGVVIVGNDSNNNRGAWVEIDDSGNYLDDRILDDRIDLYDGAVLPGGEKLLLGSDFGNRQAIITLWDGGGALFDGIRIPELKEFQELTYDGSFYYTVAQTTAAPNENVIVQFHINGSNQIVIDQALTTQNGESDFTLASINWHSSNYLLYTDGRIPLGPLGIGDFDIYISAYDMTALESECIDEYEVSPEPYNVVAIGPQMSGTVEMLPTPAGGPNCTAITYTCSEYCIEIICDPGWEYSQKSCYQIQFTDTSNVNLPATYMWDIGGDGTIDTMDQNFCYDFDCAGTYDVCLKVTDAFGQEKNICKQVIVAADISPPVCSGVVGPQDTTVLACDRGAIRSWTPPSFTDDCSDVVVTASHTPGDFFPCGTTIVSYTGENKDGLTTTCTFPVVVNCPCAQTDSTSISCGIEPDQFEFYFRLNDLTGGGNCTAAAVTLPGLGNVNVTLNQWDPVTSHLEVAGNIDATAYPFPQNFNLRVDYQCTCSDGSLYDCVHLVPFITPCCDSAFISPSGICKVKEEVFIDVEFFGTVRDIARVDYFVQAAPCPSSRWGGTPYQTSVGYQPLRLLPPFHNQDVCVYACLVLGNDEEPCDTLYTEVSTLTLCSPYDCSLNNQEYCYMGSPINPAPITYNGPLPDCDFKIEWYDDQGNLIPLPPITTTYTPPPLVFRGNPDECFQDYTYEMQLIGVCDTVSCFSTIRLWNDNAPTGSISLNPLENLPLCYGGDATLAYIDSCTMPSGNWTWLGSTDGVTYNTLSGAGNQNPLFNTNRLYADSWYGVTKTNGVCPADTTFYMLPVKDDIVITGFNLDYNDPCRETGLKLSVSYTPCVPSLNGICDCNYTIDWYRNGNLIGSSNSTQPSAGFSYVDPSLNGNYAGVYYAVVTDNCCDNSQRSQTLVADPPIALCVSGPCYICDAGQSFTLTGLVKNGPALGNNCTYQWFVFNQSVGVFQAIVGETALTHTTTKPGIYKLEMVCINGNTQCMKEVEIEVVDCTGNSTTSILTITELNIDLSLAPNPTMDRLLVNVQSDDYSDLELALMDINGVVLQRNRVVNMENEIDVRDYASGMYVVSLLRKGKAVLSKQLVIQ